MLKKNTYRPDIDGLRALAVLAVVLFHLSPTLLPNGFLGVDIFFVISGFLITTILYREMEQNNFSFANFYNRRIRRILPVCFVVIVVGLLLTRWLFLTKDFYSVANSAVASVFFLSNFYFARVGGYFDISTEERPFNHIWSLSVEEQFYFIFPLLLWLVFKSKFLRKHIIAVLLSTMFFLLCLSFLPLEKIGIHLDAYYLPHLRMIELLTGSLLAVILCLKGNHLSVQMSNILGSSTLVIVIACLCVKNVFVPPYFPGVTSLLLCVPTALLIVANEKGSYVKKLFSIPPIVWIGKLSYSLYLWHWVVLAMCRYFLGVGDLPFGVALGAFILMFLLSIITYYFVEQPFRKKKYTFKKSFLYLYLLPLIVVIAISYSLYQAKIPELQKTSSHFPPVVCEKCTTSKDTLQTLGDTKSLYPKKILFVGDNHTSHLSPFIDIVGKKEGWKADVLSAGACPSLLNTQGWKPTAECQKALDYLQEHYLQYNVIFLVNSYTTDRENIPAYTQKFIATIHTLLAAGKDVYVLNSSANFDYDVQRNQKLKKQLGIQYFTSLRGEKYKKNYKRWERFASTLKTEFPTLHIIDLSHYIPNDGCIAGKPIMYDTNHFNTYGAQQIAALFIANGEKLLKLEDRR